jgi:hypothetical protein
MIRRRLALVALLALSPAARAADVPPADQGWSKPVNQLQARVVLKRTAVSNGTTIIVPFLELRNTGAPLLFKWKSAAITLQVVDANGKEFPRNNTGAFDGGSLARVDVALPQQSDISFRLGSGGWGIPADKAGIVDMGINDAWLFDKADPDYSFKVTLEIPGKPGQRADDMTIWTGKIELAPVLIPLKAPARDPATLGKTIDDLGAKMLSGDTRIAEPAMNELSLIDDPRVIPWYAKAVATNNYGLRFNAVDRLSRFNDDAALAGLKIAMASKAGDVDNPDNIRLSAALALARSPHPDSKKLLMTMAHDPYHGVRVTVLHAMDQLNTPESLAVIRDLLNDPNDTVANEALRYMKMRDPAATRGK